MLKRALYVAIPILLAIILAMLLGNCITQPQSLRHVRSTPHSGSMPLDSARRRITPPSHPPTSKQQITHSVTANYMPVINGKKVSVDQAGLPSRLNLKCVHADGKGRELTCTQVPSLDN